MAAMTKNAGLHAANKMLSRMEEAIDCVKWYQYNHQIFTDRKSVKVVYETPGMTLLCMSAMTVKSGLLQCKQYSKLLPLGNPQNRNRKDMLLSGVPKTENKPSSEAPTGFSTTDQQKSDKGQADLEVRVAHFEEKMDEIMSRIEKTLRSLTQIMVAKPKDSILRQAGSPEKKSESPARCFRCNEEGHYKRDCPNKRVSFKLQQMLGEDLNDSGSDLEA